MLRLLLPTAAGLAVGVWIISCGDIVDEADFDETIPALTGLPDDGGEPDVPDSSDAFDDNSQCESLPFCVETDDGDGYRCPDTAPQEARCKQLDPCGDRPRCATDETACLAACGRVDCAILDIEPERVQCPDQ